MNSIEKLSEIIASKISYKSSSDQDEQEILAYGAFVLIQTIISITAVALFGIAFGVLFESLVISFAASILRKFSGGAHATSPINCILISVIIFGGLALLVNHYLIYAGFYYIMAIIIISFSFTYYVMYKYSPVGTTNKPLRNESTRKRLKEKSIKFVYIMSVLVFLLIIIYLKTKQIHLLVIVVCISLGIAWQSVTLVSLGHKIIDGLDKVLRGTNRIIRRNDQ